MDVREKLVELCEDLETLPCCDTYEEQAEYLISHGVTVQEWISVEDRLPEKKGTFLVYVKANNKWSGWSGYIKTTWFTPCYEGAEDRLQCKKIWYDYDSEFGDYEVRNVTHWMPLPQPPKGE